jgi:hypothetical protein
MLAMLGKNINSSAHLAGISCISTCAIELMDAVPLEST